MSPRAVLRVYVQLPAELHAAMRAIRHARRECEGTDVRLCRLYQEAVEQYVHAKPQRELLNGAGARGK